MNKPRDARGRFVATHGASGRVATHRSRQRSRRGVIGCDKKILRRRVSVTISRRKKRSSSSRSRSRSRLRNRSASRSRSGGGGGCQRVSPDKLSSRHNRVTFNSASIADAYRERLKLYQTAARIGAPTTAKERNRHPTEAYSDLDRPIVTKGKRRVYSANRKLARTMTPSDETPVYPGYQKYDDGTREMRLDRHNEAKHIEQNVRHNLQTNRSCSKCRKLLCKCTASRRGVR